jgi:hypothetical protein
MWKLKQIFDGEYGCEERQPGEKEKCLVILANEEGEEKTFEANEDWIAAIEKLSANPLMKIIISKPMAKDCQYKKIVVEKKGDGYQAAKYTEKQVFHDNFGVFVFIVGIRAFQHLVVFSASCEHGGAKQ